VGRCSVLFASSASLRQMVSISAGLPQEVPDILMEDRPAAGGNDRVLAADHFGQQVALQETELPPPVLGDDLPDGLPCPGHEHLVHVDEIEVQVLGQRQTHQGLAGGPVAGQDYFSPWCEHMATLLPAQGEKLADAHRAVTVQLLNI